MIKAHRIQRIKGRNRRKAEEALAVEEPLEIWLRTYSAAGHSEVRRLITTMRTPGDDEALVRGWLHTAAHLSSDNIVDIAPMGSATARGRATNQMLVRLRVGRELPNPDVQRTDVSHTSCGVCGSQSIETLLSQLPAAESLGGCDISPGVIAVLLEQLRRSQPVFRKTGATHGAALFDRQGKLIDCREDIGRHNALDKLIGANLKRLPGPYGILLSGRVSFEMVQKTAMAGVSTLVAIGAPTSLAVELCEELDVTLVGFIRSGQFNCYSGSLAEDLEHA